MQHAVLYAEAQFVPGRLSKEVGSLASPAKYFASLTSQTLHVTNASGTYIKYVWHLKLNSSLSTWWGSSWFFPAYLGSCTYSRMLDKRFRQIVKVRIQEEQRTSSLPFQVLFGVRRSFLIPFARVLWTWRRHVTVSWGNAGPQCPCLTKVRAASASLAQSPTRFGWVCSCLWYTWPDPWIVTQRIPAAQVSFLHRVIGLRMQRLLLLTEKSHFWQLGHWLGCRLRASVWTFPGHVQLGGDPEVDPKVAGEVRHLRWRWKALLYFTVASGTLHWACCFCNPTSDKDGWMELAVSKYRLYRPKRNEWPYTV